MNDCIYFSSVIYIEYGRYISERNKKDLDIKLNTLIIVAILGGGRARGAVAPLGFYPCSAPLDENSFFLNIFHIIEKID